MLARRTTGGVAKPQAFPQQFAACCPDTALARYGDVMSLPAPLICRLFHAALQAIRERKRNWLPPLYGDGGDPSGGSRRLNQVLSRTYNPRSRHWVSVSAHGALCSSVGSSTRVGIGAFQRQRRP